MITPVNVDELERLLIQSCYDSNETKFLVSGFRNGFPIGYDGDMNAQLTVPNLYLECGNKKICGQK